MRIEIIGLRHYNTAKLGLPVPLIGHAAVEAFNTGIVNWQQLLKKEIALVQNRLSAALGYQTDNALAMSNAHRTYKETH